MNKLEMLREALRGLHLDAAAIFCPETIFLLTGAAVDEGCCVVEPDRVTLVVESGAQPQRPGLRLITYKVCGFARPEHRQANHRAALTGLLASVRALGTDADYAPFWLNRCLSDCEITDLSERLESLRLTKPAAFEADFARAAAVNHAAYAAVRKALRPGMTGPELLAEISRAEILTAGGLTAFKGDFLIGRDTASIGGFSAETVAKPGDAVIVDLLSRVGGAHCDTTRTFFLGAPDDEQRRAYNAVLDALRAGEALLRPGVTAAEVYRAVSARLEAAGCDPLPHHAGHGVGCSWYEPPYFIPGCTTPLQAGMIVTLEPGVYLRDRFGVRIENNYLIEANGCRALFGGLTELDDNTVGG